MTKERLRSYLASCDNDLERALQLYEWNLTASAAIIQTVAMIEVIVRNTLDSQLVAWARRGGPDSWWSTIPLDHRGRADIIQACDQATNHGHVTLNHGKVVAEPSFGFWRYLTAQHYHTNLWYPRTPCRLPGRPPRPPHPPPRSRTSFGDPHARTQSSHSPRTDTPPHPELRSGHRRRTLDLDTPRRRSLGRRQDRHPIGNVSQTYDRMSRTKRHSRQPMGRQASPGSVLTRQLHRSVDMSRSDSSRSDLHG